MKREFDVVGIGNALVDVVSKVDERAFKRITNLIPMQRGAFQLIDGAGALKLHNILKRKNYTQTSGGSIANSLVGLASFGSSTAMIGNVSHDPLGKFFIDTLRHDGVHFLSKPKPVGASGHCLILGTPDGERTMNTHLGISSDLSPDDIDQDLIKNASVVFMEGYMFDRPSNKDAFFKAAAIALASDKHTAFSLSSEFAVRANLEDVRSFTSLMADITFANEKEIKALAQTESFEDAVAHGKSSLGMFVITRGAKGAVIVAGDKVIDIPVIKPTALVDTTGAGDAFASGFLAGYVRGFSLEKCGHLGALAGASNVSHIGARPQEDYSRFLKLV